MKQDPYASSVFSQVDSTPGSSWSWCEECQETMPDNHVCGKTQIASTSDLQEDIDYWSVEAVVRGWHGEGSRRKVLQEIRDGMYDRNETKTTRYYIW